MTVFSLGVGYLVLGAWRKGAVFAVFGALVLLAAFGTALSGLFGDGDHVFVAFWIFVGAYFLLAVEAFVAVMRASLRIRLAAKAT